MIDWIVVVPKRVKKKLDRFPENVREIVLLFIDSLHRTPFTEGYDIRKMKGRKNHYRVRFGKYRIVYCVNKKEKTIVLINAGHRRSIYES